jgi:cell wall-associated NlpC family hydrolase
MPNFIKTTMAAAATVGLVALTPTGAQATTQSSSTTTSSSSTVVPAAHLRLTKRERQRLVHHRRALRRNHEVSRALTVAARQQGDPYRYGAAGPGAFDCSGLMLYSFRAAGLHLPRTAAAQSGAVRHIPRSHMRRGDLVFFTSGSHVYHVGIFDGFSHGRRIIIHAPFPGARVRKEAIWTNAWFAGTLRLS